MRNTSLHPICLVLGFSAAIAIDLCFGRHEASSEGPALALVSLALFVLAVGLSILAGYLLQKKQKSPISDERPTALATRGSYIGWFRGIRRLGYTLVWAGDRGSRKERAAGGKGDTFSGPKQKVYLESGMHVICVGRPDALLQIESGGKIIFDGPITPDSHPSGSLVDLGGEGSFRMFWGEDDQPVNTYLGDSTRQGVNSRWPNLCYIEWRARRLGPQPQWPLMSYVMMMKPTGNHLSNTEPWQEATRSLTGPSFTSFISVNGVANTIELDGNRTADIDTLMQMRLTGNALPDQDLNVVTMEPVPILAGTIPWQIIVGYTSIVTFEEDLTGIDLNGTLQAYDTQPDDGSNPAHEFADMLFEKWPLGLSLSKDDWDMDSLEDMGTLAVTENLRTTLIATDADTAQQKFGAALQDLGYMVPIDNATGLVRFDPMRKELGAVSHISEGHIVGNLPELEKVLGEKPVDFMVFGFSDRVNNFRDMTLGRMEDGQIAFLEVARARNIPITNTTHYDTASRIANRRSQEEMSQGAIWSIDTNRGTREFMPGQVVTADFTDELLRIIEIEPVPDSNRVGLKITTDSYGSVIQEFDDEAPPAPPGVLPAELDVTFAMIEASEYFAGVPPQTILIPRIRAHSQIDQAALHISTDGITYSQVSSTDVHNPGGTLTVALSADGLFEPDDGEVQFTTLGPDIGDAQDLTGDDESWRLGMQVVIINSSAGTEFCFCKKTTVVSGDVYSLDGLIRARYESRRLAHPIGAQVFFVNLLDMTPIQNAILIPEVTRYAKTQPSGSGTVSLAAVPATATLLYGKGARPLPVAALRVTAPDLVNVYAAGQDVTAVWDWATPRTPGNAAGLQHAGQGVSETAPEGEFQVDILTSGEVLVASYSAVTAEFIYANADLQTDLGSEPSFIIRVIQFRDGMQSDSQQILVEKI